MSRIAKADVRALAEDDPQREDVAAGIDGLALDLLWRHVAEGCHDFVGSEMLTGLEGQSSGDSSTRGEPHPR